MHTRPNPFLSRRVSRCAALLFVCAAAHVPCEAQLLSPVAPRAWAATLGGPDDDRILALAARADGGVFLAGRTSSSVSDADVWLARLDRRGRALWEFALDQDGHDEAPALLATPDGGCLVAGTTYSTTTGLSDAWILKLEADGTSSWHKSYATPVDERLTALAFSPDGYYAAGQAVDVNGIDDLWVLELDLEGDVLWQERFPAPGFDNLASIAASEEGLVVLANSSSDLPGSPAGFFSRPWLLSLDGAGQSLWQKTYDFSGGDALSHILALEDGGFVASGEILASAFFRGDAWVVRLDAAGDVVWDRRFGDHFGFPGYDGALGVRPTGEGGLAVFAASDTARDGMWVLQLAANGALLWDRSYGLNLRTNGSAFDRAPNGDLFLAGFYFGGNADDTLVLRLSPRGQVPLACELAHSTDPNQWSSALTVLPVVLAPEPTRHPVASLTTTLVPLSTARLLCRSGGG